MGWPSCCASSDSINATCAAAVAAELLLLVQPPGSHQQTTGALLAGWHQFGWTAEEARRAGAWVGTAVLCLTSPWGSGKPWGNRPGVNINPGVNANPRVILSLVLAQPFQTLDPRSCTLGFL